MHVVIDQGTGYKSWEVMLHLYKTLISLDLRVSCTFLVATLHDVVAVLCRRDSPA